MANVAKDLRTALYAGQSSPVLDVENPVPATTLWSLTDRFAGALRADDVGRDDVVALQIGSPVELLVGAYGALRNGSVPAVVPTHLGPEATADALAAADPSVLVSDDPSGLTLLAKTESIRLLITHEVDDATLGVAFEDFLEGAGLVPGGSRTGIDVVRRRDDADAMIAFVDRGEETTAPRGVVFSHGALRLALRTGCSHPLGTDVRRHLGTFPLDRPIGLVYGATATIVDGGCYAPLGTWDVDAVRASLSGGAGRAVDRAYLTPEQYDDLAAHVNSVPEQVFVVDPTSEAASVSESDVARLCGLPETGITHCRSPDAVAAGRLGESVGPVETTVIGNGTGELAIASDAAMSGYLDPGHTEAVVRETDGKRWIKTGAHASVAEDGFYLTPRREPA